MLVRRAASEFRGSDVAIGSLVALFVNEFVGFGEFGGHKKGMTRGTGMIGNSGRGLYTVIEAARLLGVGRSTMYDLVRRGEVSSLRLGRKVLITRPTLEALLGYEPPMPAELVAEQDGASGGVGGDPRRR